MQPPTRPKRSATAVLPLPSYIQPRPRTSSGPSTTPDRDMHSSAYGPEPAAHTASSLSYDSDFDTSIASLPKRSRGSILVAASDALNLRFRRRKPSVKAATPQNQTLNILLPDVIEISAPTRQDEDEERDRLRAAAAQSIGLGPDVLHDTMSIEESLHDTEEDERFADDVADLDAEEQDVLGPSTPSPLSTAAAAHSRLRAGSLALSLARPRPPSSPTPVQPIPRFPSTTSALAAFAQLQATLPKYYPGASLFTLKFSKQWKTRYIVLTSPIAAATNGRTPKSSSSTPMPSYLHLFKSSGKDDRELERLEVNEDSVVFVAEEDVGGRKNVITVGGADVGARKRDLNPEQEDRTMWLLQIVDPQDSQTWMNAIKNAILSQRTVRAGLGMAAQGGAEPRGDMDVQLSMRKAGLLASTRNELQRAPSSMTTHTLGTGGIEQISTSSKSVSVSTPPESLRMHPTPSKPAPANAVSALKGLFRPRSPSHASVLAPPDTADVREDASFTSAGLALRAPGGDSGLSSPTSPAFAHAYPGSPVENLEQKIVQHHRSEEWTKEPDAAPRESGHRHRSGSLSLLPPPRRRPWTMNGVQTPKIEAEEPPMAEDELQPQPPPEDDTPSTASASSMSPVSRDTPTTPGLSGFAFFGTPEQKPRAPSLSSVSTFASGENGNGVDKRGSRRWSRSTLPKMLTPPAGPLPPVPSPGSGSSETEIFRSPSRASSARSPPTSPRSSSSSRPPFSKRGSNASAHSVGTLGTAQSWLGLSPPKARNLKRLSLPPPSRPLPPTPKRGSYDGAAVGASASAFGASSRSLVRESRAQRAIRLSLTPPSRPPTGALPPRPDEPTHRRTSSAGAGAAHPMPIGRHQSLKQRLRLLSTSSPTASLRSVRLGSASPPADGEQPAPRSPPRTPRTPLAEPIVQLPKEADFLTMDDVSDRLRLQDLTPTMPETTPLSPPPRRGSRQLETRIVEPEDEPEHLRPKTLSLSRQDSAFFGLANGGP